MRIIGFDMRIIGFDMRIKEEQWVNFMGSAGRNNWQRFEHIRLKLNGY